MNINKELKIAVAGCGRMGIGIAQVFAYEGFPVMLIDAKERDIIQWKNLSEKAYLQISNHLSFLSGNGIMNKIMIPKILDKIVFCHHTQIKEHIQEADIIFEAVPERLDVKEAVYMIINRVAKRDAIIASTTSTFLVNELAEYLIGPERFLCTHWLNPAYLMPLVELSPGKFTSHDTFQLIFTLLESIGKIPVKCNPSPGFIVPRIQALAMNEAARLAEEGVASPEDIDKATRFGFGLRFAVLGLLEFIDWGGGDILYYADEYLKDSLGDDRFSPPQVIVDNMKHGYIGLKSGKGFFDYTQLDTVKYQEETITKFIDLLKHLGLIRSPFISE